MIDFYIYLEEELVYPSALETGDYPSGIKERRSFGLQRDVHYLRVTCSYPVSYQGVQNERQEILGSF